MGKELLIFVFFVVSAVCGANQDILQQSLNGIFDQNKLPHPTTVIGCIDETTAKQIVDFIGVTLDKLAKGSLSQLMDTFQEILHFPTKLPSQVNDCLYENDELWTLGAKYGVTNQTEGKKLEKEFTDFFLTNFFSFHKQMGVLNTEWKAKSYSQCGFDTAAYAHLIWKLTANSLRKFRHISELKKISILAAQKLAQIAASELFTENKIPANLKKLIAFA